MKPPTTYQPYFFNEETVIIPLADYFTNESGYAVTYECSTTNAPFDNNFSFCNYFSSPTDKA